MKWTSLPYWELPAELATGKQPEGIFRNWLLPHQGDQARTRLQQSLSLLQRSKRCGSMPPRTRESWPASLAVTKLPVPADPVTGKPFIYEVMDGVAVIRARPPQTSRRPLLQPGLRGKIRP